MVSVTPLELPDRTLVTVGTDHLVRSSDGGKTWKAILDPLPFHIAGLDTGSLTYSVDSKTFFVDHFECGKNAVLPDAIMSAGFDWR
jgi:hypothetical protein